MNLLVEPWRIKPNTMPCVLKLAMFCCLSAAAWGDSLADPDKLLVCQVSGKGPMCRGLIDAPFLTMFLRLCA